MIAAQNAGKHRPEASVGHKTASASAASSNAVVKAGDQQQLQRAVAKNPHPVKAGPPNVLQEEDYVEAVGDIIERDFFPDLPRFRVEHELVQARLSGDYSKAQAAAAKLLRLPRPTPTPGCTPGHVTPSVFGGGATPSQSVASAEAAAALVELASRGGSSAGIRAAGAALRAARTPQSHPSATPQHSSAWEHDDGAASVCERTAQNAVHLTRLKKANGKEVLVDLSTVRLDDFHRVFTSEDNASFEEVMRRDQERLREKERWMENIEENHNTKIQAMARALENGESLPSEPMMTNPHTARNPVFIHPVESPVVLQQEEKPRVDFSNTRFTTRQHSELDARLGQTILNRTGLGTDAAVITTSDGRFDFGVLRNAGMWKGAPRAYGGRIDMSPLVRTKTPTLIAGNEGIPDVSQQFADDDDRRPSFRIQEESQQDKAADLLVRSTTQQKRDSKQQTRLERLRALGITPRDGTPTGCNTVGTPVEATARTPAALAASSRRPTPLTPIGQLLQRAKRMAQQGGRLRIASSPAPSMGHASSGRTPRRGAETPAGDMPAQKRLRRSDGPSSSAATQSALPASITDGLL